MVSNRRGSERGRREVLLRDLDGFDCSRRLFSKRSVYDGLHDAVRAAVEEALTPRQREIVQAHFFEGLSQGAIARRLGVTQQVVQKALFGDVRRGQRVGGALSRLRAALAPLVVQGHGR